MNIIKSIWPFRGTLAAALLHNWLVVRRVFMPGTPTGVTVDSQHAPVGFDLTLVKQLGKCETKHIGVMAAQGFGKTFWATMMILIGLAQDVGGGYARASYPSLKHNNGRPETAPLVEDLLGCKVLSPKNVKLNPLARALDMTFEEQYTMVVRMLQFIRNQALSLEESKILQDTLKTLYDDLTIEPSFNLLHELLVSYNFVPTPGQENINQYKFTKRFLKAALQLQLTVEMLQKGLYGSLFTGDSTEIVKLLEARIVSWDYKGVSSEVRSLIEIVLGAIHTSAILPYPELDKTDPMYGKPKHPERVPHMMVNDEAYAAWANPDFADAEYERMKTQRAHGITSITLFHRPADLQEAIGQSNTRQLEKAQNALREIEVWLVGRQHRSALDDIRKFLNPPEYVVRSLPKLGKGYFWVITPWNPPFLMAVIGSELEVSTFNTDGANHQLLQKYYRTHKVKDYMKFLNDTTPSEEEFEESELQEQSVSDQGEREYADVT